MFVLACRRNWRRLLSFRRVIVLAQLDVFVFVAGPPRVAGKTLDVKTFEPPAANEELVAGELEPATTSALETRSRS